MQKNRIEQHYTTGEVAAMLAVSTDTVVRWFRDDAATIKLAPHSTRGRRRRSELRIPESSVQAKVAELRRSM